MGFKALIQDDRNRDKMTHAIQDILELNANESEGALHNEIWLALYRFQEATTSVLKKVGAYRCILKKTIACICICIVSYMSYRFLLFTPLNSIA